MDKKDYQIIISLDSDSRLPYRVISKNIGISINAVHKRVTELIRLGIIHKFKAELSWEAVGAVGIMIAGKPASDSSANIDEIVQRLARNRATLHITVAGGNFLYIYGFLHNISELDRYVSFVKKETHLEKPIVGILQMRPPLDPDKFKLTTLDYRIILAYSKNTRRNITEVAEGLRVSAKTVRRRIDKMLEDGTVYFGLYGNLTAAGDIISIFNLTLKNETEKKDAVSFIRNTVSENIISVTQFSNLSDFLTSAMWAKSMKELKQIQDTLHKSGIFREIVPNIYFNTYWFDTWKDDILLEKTK